MDAATSSLDLSLGLDKSTEMTQQIYDSTQTQTAKNSNLQNQANNRIIACQICQKEFNNKSNYNRHIRQQHLKLQVVKKFLFYLTFLILFLSALTRSFILSNIHSLGMPLPILPCFSNFIIKSNLALSEIRLLGLDELLSSLSQLTQCFNPAKAPLNGDHAKCC